MGSASASCAYRRGKRARNSSVNSFMVLARLKNLAGFFELLKLFPFGFDLLFCFGDLCLELVGLLQDHLYGRLLLPRFAFGLGHSPRRTGRLRIGRFLYWHCDSPWSVGFS